MQGCTGCPRGGSSLCHSPGDREAAREGTGTLRSPEDSGSAPARLCRHGRAAPPASLLPHLHRAGGDSTGARRGSTPPGPAASGSAWHRLGLCPLRRSPRAVPCAGPCRQLPRQPGGARTPRLKPGRGAAVGRGARGFHNPRLAVYLSAGAGPGGGCLFAESAGSRPRGGGKGSRGTRLGRPARHWGGAGMGTALPAPPSTQLGAPTAGRTPILPAHTGTHSPGAAPHPWGPAGAPMGRPTAEPGTQGWLGVGHRVPCRALQRVPGSHGHRQGTVPAAGSASAWAQGPQLSPSAGTALAWGLHIVSQGPWPHGAACGPPGYTMAPELCRPGGAAGWEAQEEPFMFAGAKCSPGTAPAVPGPNYSTPSCPSPPAPTPGPSKASMAITHPCPQRVAARPPSTFPMSPWDQQQPRGSGNPAAPPPVGPHGQKVLHP